MFITKIRFHPDLSPGFFANRNAIHGIAESMFPLREHRDNSQGRMLFRFEYKKGRPILTMTSIMKPSFQHLLGRVIEKAEDVVCVSYQDVHNSIQVGDILQLNMIAAVHTGQRKEIMKDLPIAPTEHNIQTQWFSETAKFHGFSYEPHHLQIHPNAPVYFQKKTFPHPFPIDNFTVTLPIYVDNAKKIKRFLRFGTGYYKAYGFGMPVLQPAKENVKQGIHKNRVKRQNIKSHVLATPEEVWQKKYERYNAALQNTRPRLLKTPQNLLATMQQQS